MKPLKISFRSAHSDNSYFHFFYPLLKFGEVSQNYFSNRCLKFQLSILQNKKVLSLKKYFLGHCQYQNKKALFTDPIFSEGWCGFLTKSFILMLLKVTCVHKANIMKLGDGLFMRSCDEIAKMYPNIQYDNMIGLFHL